MYMNTELDLLVLLELDFYLRQTQTDGQTDRQTDTDRPANGWTDRHERYMYTSIPPSFHAYIIPKGISARLRTKDSQIPNTLGMCAAWQSPRHR